MGNFILGKAGVQVGVEGLQQVEADLLRLKGSFQSGISSVQGLGIAAGIGMVSAMAAIGGLVKMSASADDAIRNLSTALEANGEAGGNAAAELEGYAEALAKASNETKMHVSGLMTQGLQLGISREQIEAYSQTAIGLARARGVSEEEAMNALARANRGNEQGLARLMGSKRGQLTGEMALAEAQRMSAIGMKERQGDMDTFSGRMVSLQNVLEEAGQTLGSVFQPTIASGIQKITGWVVELQTWLKGLSSEVKDGIVKWAMYIGIIAAVVAIVPVVIGGFGLVAGAIAALFSPIGLIVGALVGLVAWFLKTSSTGATLGQKIAHIWDDAIAYWTFFKDAVTVLWKDIGEVMELGGLKAETVLLNLWDIVRWLWDNFKNFLNWFGDNWVDVFKSAGSAVLSILENLGHNIKEIATSIFDFFADPTKGWRPPDFKDLLDGYKNSVKEMPKYTKLYFSDPFAQQIQGLESSIDDKLKPAYDKLHASLAANKVKAEEIAQPAKTAEIKPVIPKIGPLHQEKTMEKGGMSGGMEILNKVTAAAMGEVTLPKQQLDEQKKSNKYLAALAERQKEHTAAMKALHDSFEKRTHHGVLKPAAVGTHVLREADTMMYRREETAATVHHTPGAKGRFVDTGMYAEPGASGKARHSPGGKWVDTGGHSPEAVALLGHLVKNVEIIGKHVVKHSTRQPPTAVAAP